VKHKAERTDNDTDCQIFFECFPLVDFHYIQQGDHTIKRDFHAMPLNLSISHSKMHIKTSEVHVKT
jgi:hypothetical protein